jgi:UDP-2,3-diacylglucosamine hydrolase
VFTNPFLNGFRWLHPDISSTCTQYLSVKNKLIGDEDVTFREDNEWLILYSKRKLETKHYNYLSFRTPPLHNETTCGKC